MMKTSSPWYQFRTVALCLSVFCAGCQQTGDVNTVQRETPLADLQVSPDSRIITSRELNRYASVEMVNETREPGGLIQIQAKVTNLTTRTEQIHYQILWFEENGMIVNSPLPVWKVIPIYAGEVRYLSGVAPNPRVVDYQIKFLDTDSYRKSGTQSGAASSPRNK